MPFFTATLTPPLIEVRCEPIVFTPTPNRAADRPRRRPRFAADRHPALVAEHGRRRREVGIDRQRRACR